MTPLQTALAEDRLTHGAWTRTDNDGRRLLCVLAAMSPEVAEAANAAACPAHVAPPWLAYLIPWMDDAPSDAYRPEVWRRVADLQARWVERWPKGWPDDVSRRADLRCRRIAVVEARGHAPVGEAGVLAAIDAVIALLDRAIAGDEPSDIEWRAAWAAAWAASAARAAASAAAVGGTLAAAVGASDRMIGAMLDIVEAEVADGEGARG